MGGDVVLSCNQASWTRNRRPATPPFTLSSSAQDTTCPLRPGAICDVLMGSLSEPAHHQEGSRSETARTEQPESCRVGVLLAQPQSSQGRVLLFTEHTVVTETVSQIDSGSVGQRWGLETCASVGSVSTGPGGLWVTRNSHTKGVNDDGSLPSYLGQGVLKLPEFRPQDSGCPESLCLAHNRAPKASGLHTGNRLRRGRSTAWGLPSSPRTGPVPGDAPTCILKITCPKGTCH